MARDAFGRDPSPFTKDVTQSFDPRSEPGSLYEAAGQHAGQAAQIKGQANAETITALGNMAVNAYQGWVESEAAKSAQFVTEGLKTPEFMGPRAYQLETEQLALDKDKAAAATLGEVPDTVTKGFEERAKKITEGVSSGVFTQAQANARLATNMRELIAANPGQAERIRKVYSAYTGRGDWDVRPIEHALTAQQKESEQAKAIARTQEKEAWDLSESGITSKFGVKSATEALLHIQQGTDVGVQMTTVRQANNFIEKANKTMTQGSMNEYYSAAMVAAGASRVSAVQPIIAELKVKGIDINNMSAVTAAQRPLIESAYRDMKVAERNALEGAIKGLEAKMASNPSMDMSVAQTTLDNLKKNLSDTPLTKDFDSMFTELQKSATARNMAADTVLKAGQIGELTLKTFWSDKMVGAMKDPRTRAQMVADYPNNPAVKELAAVFDGRQNSFSKEFRQYEMIADGLFNSAAPWAHVAAVEQAKTTEEGRKAIAAVTQLEMGEGKKVLSAGNPVTDKQAVSAITLAKNYDPKSGDFDTLYRSVMSGKYEDSFRNDTSNIAVFTKETLGRNERFLSTVDKHSYPVVLKELMTKVPGAQLGMDEAGNVRLIKGKPTGNMIADAPAYQLQTKLLEVNKVLQMHYKLSGDKDGVRGQQLIMDTNAVDVGKPWTLQGMASDVWDNLPDNLNAQKKQEKGFNLDKLADAVKIAEGSKATDVSVAGAKGVYQFIPETGKRYGLLSDADFQDEVKSREAAKKYFQDITKTIGTDDPAAIFASYNAGEGNVKKAMEAAKKAGEPSEWLAYLDTSPENRAQTRAYVKRAMKAYKG